MKRFVPIAAAAALSCVGLAACTNNRPASVLTVEGAEVLPHATAQDWVTYADTVAIFTAVSESRDAKDPDEIERGEGIVMRNVAVSIDKPVWSREETGPELPTTLTIGNGGWVFEGDEEQPIRFEGQINLVVGQRYLAAFAYTNLGDDAGPKEWNQLEMMAVDETSGTVAPSKAESGEKTDPMTESATGETVDSVVDLLEATKPDPAAGPYDGLDPAERYQKVLGN